MKKLSYLQAMKTAKNLENKSLQHTQITFLRNITIESITPYIEIYFAENQQKAQCLMGDFDNIFQNSLNDSLICKDTQLVSIFYDFTFAYRHLKYQINTKSVDEINTLINDFINFTNQIITNIRQRTNGTIIWNSFIEELHPVAGVVDNQIRSSSINQLIGTLNNQLKLCLQNDGNAYLINSQNIVSRIGYQQFHDIDKSLAYSAPYTPYALQCFAQQLAIFSAKTSGKIKKCLVLDCDNTLWGGIVGEDLSLNLQLGGSVLGEKFKEFQAYCLALSQQGVLLALCSKNNSNDVWQVFDEHQNMLLTKNDISCAQINWHNKAHNISLIAKELNIDLSALVFVDDSSVECELVKTYLPEVTVVQMQADPIETLQEIQSCGYFDNLYSTNEDKSKGKQYQEQKERQSLANEINDIDDYIKTLTITLNISQSPTTQIARIAQLSQKTNQFNLTSIRYNAIEVEQLILDSHSDIFTLAVKDKFGDLGTVGAVFIKYQNNKLIEIENFIMSCRCLGRKVEFEFLNALCQKFKAQNFQIITGVYQASEKNQQTQLFYPRAGFSALGSIKEQDKKSFSLKLSEVVSSHNLMTVELN